MADNTQAISSAHPDKVTTLKDTLENFIIKFEGAEREPHDLKVQMVYQEGMVNDAEAESAILRKRLREMEEESCRWERMLRESVAAREKLEKRIEGLELSLATAGVGSTKSNSELDLIFFSSL